MSSGGQLTISDNATITANGSSQIIVETSLGAGGLDTEVQYNNGGTLLGITGVLQMGHRFQWQMIQN